MTTPVIERVIDVTDELVAAVRRLLPQLSAHATPPTAADLGAIARDAVLLVARAAAGAPITGVLTLTLYRIPTGLQARIDDVVVDDGARGAGLGEALTRAAIEHARAAGALAIGLTSHASRAAANRLYQRLGFGRRDTNVYKLALRGG